MTSEDEYISSEDEDFKVENVSDDEELGSDVDDAVKRAVEDQNDGSRERFARTRSQVPQQEEKKVVVKESKVDVDALWAAMNSGPAAVAPAVTASKPVLTPTSVGSSSESPGSDSPTTPVTPAEVHTSTAKGSGAPTDEMVTITRTFKFAGKITTETKTVKATSAEGRDYLRQTQAQAQQEAQVPAPRKKPGPVKRKSTLAEEYAAGKAKKLNTLDKSRLDWLGFVDNQGINDDLKKHNKNGYLDKQGFLARVDMNMERKRGRGV